MLEQVARPAVGSLLVFPSMVRVLRKSGALISRGVVYVLAMTPAVGYGMAIYAWVHQMAAILATAQPSPILADVLADCMLPTLLKLTGTSAAGWMLALFMRRGKVAFAYFSVLVAPFMLIGVCLVLEMALLFS